MSTRKSTRDDLIVAAYQRGVPVAQILEAAEISLRTLYAILKRAGVRRNCAPHRPDLTPECVAAAYRQYGTLERTATGLHTTVHTVRTRLLQAGIRPRREGRVKRPARPDVTPGQAVAAYEHHGSLRRAARALGTTAPTIAARLRQAGYRIRLNARRQGRLVPLLLLLTLLLTRPAQAQPGDVRPPPAASWWLLPAQEPAPTVAVDAGESGAQCSEVGCVVWAQGGWTRVWVDGAVLAERGRVWLPVISTTTRPAGP